MTKDLTPIGLVFPLRRGTQGFFQQSYDSNAQAKASLINLLSTMPGERPLNPAFGSKLYYHIFNPEIDESLVQTVIENDVAMWIPSIAVDRVDIDLTGVDNEVIQLSVHYNANNTSGSATIYIKP